MYLIIEDCCVELPSVLLAELLLVSQLQSHNNILVIGTVIEHACVCVCVCSRATRKYYSVQDKSIVCKSRMMDLGRLFCPTSDYMLALHNTTAVRLGKLCRETLAPKSGCLDHVMSKDT